MTGNWTAHSARDSGLSRPVPLPGVQHDNGWAREMKGKAWGALVHAPAQRTLIIRTLAFFVVLSFVACASWGPTSD